MTQRPGLTSTGTATILLPVLGLVLAIALWWLATIVFSIEAYLLPSPPDVISAFRAQPGYLMSQTWVSLLETVEGFLLSIVVGGPIALAIVRSTVLERVIYPLLLAGDAIRKVAIVPLLWVWM